MPHADASGASSEVRDFIVGSRKFDAGGNIESESALTTTKSQAISMGNFETNYPKKGMFDR